MQNKQVFGLTNKITVKNNILYKKSQPFCDLFLNRTNEINIYDQLSKLNYNWYIIPCKWEYKEILKTETFFYNNATTLDEVNICVNIMKTVISLINKIHNLNLQAISIFDPLNFLNLFKKNVKQEIKDLNVYEDRISKIITNYWSDQSIPVFSHNDLVSKNFINFKKGWKIIDFEYACYNHYLFDYASFISESLPFKKWDKFINLLSLNYDETKKIKDIIFYQNYLWAYWAIYMFEKTENKIFLQIYEEKANNLFKT